MSFTILNSKLSPIANHLNSSHLNYHYTKTWLRLTKYMNLAENQGFLDRFLMRFTPCQFSNVTSALSQNWEKVLLQTGNWKKSNIVKLILQPSPSFVMVYMMTYCRCLWCLLILYLVANCQMSSGPMDLFLSMCLFPWTYFYLCGLLISKYYTFWCI